MDNLNKLSFKLRKDVVLLIAHSGTGHIGGDMSVMDILVTLYFKHMNIDPSDPDNPDRDRFILSKGHCIEALYMVLAERGFLDKKEIFENYGMFDSDFIGHPNNKISGIEMNTGSLGHGLSIGVGMALASRMDNRNNRVYVVLGDGELEEGSVWEAAMAASCYGLVNICAVVDRNRLQISGSTEDVMALEPLNDKWKSFGWNVISCNGNSCHFTTRQLLSMVPTRFLIKQFFREESQFCIFIHFGIIFKKADIFPHCSFKQKRILWNIQHILAKRIKRYVADIFVVDGNSTFCYICSFQKCFHDRTFSCT